MSDTAYLDQQWHSVAQALLAQARGREFHSDNFFDRERHNHERADMVGAIGKAFIFHWAGRLPPINGPHEVVETQF